MVFFMTNIRVGLLKIIAHSSMGKLIAYMRVARPFNTYNSHSMLDHFAQPSMTLTSHMTRWQTPPTPPSQSQSSPR